MKIKNENAGDRVEVYNIIAEFPFDSTRKRMSLMVKTAEGQVILLCKGADTIMLPRMAFP